MRRFGLILVLLLASPLLAGRTERFEQSSQILQMDRMLTIRIHMSAEQWKMMQPHRASRLAVALGVVQHPTTQRALDSVNPPVRSKAKRKPVEGEPRSPGLVGNEYPYVRATVDIDGEKLSDVGIRFKGQWSYALAGNAPRRPLKLKFDHFVDGQDYNGIEALSLCANGMDPSQLRNTLGYAFFRDAGLPAPRTCFALVYLTVDGVYSNELLGLFTAIEEVNKDFLNSRFGTTKGLVIRPERTRNLAYVGSRWEDFDRYNIQTDATEFTASRFMGFTRLIHLADDETFCSEIGDYLDVDEFLRFLAVNVVMINLDGVLVNGHNFYIHVHPKTGKLSFVPWDLHYSFGTHGQNMDEWVNLTIDRPYRITNRLVERIMSIGWMRESYREYLREFATGAFSPRRMQERIDQLEQVVRKAEAIARSTGKELPVTPTKDQMRPRPDLRPFVEGRVKSILEQLAWMREGDPIGGRPPAPKPPAPAPKAAAPIPRPATRPEIVATRAPRPVVSPTTRPAIFAAPTPKPVAPTTRPAPAGGLSMAVMSTTAVQYQPPPTPTTRKTISASRAVPSTRPAVAATPPPIKPTPKSVVTPKPTPAPKPVVKPTPPKPAPKPRPLPPSPVARLILSNIDLNHDGQLSRDEFADGAKHVFIAGASLHRGAIDELSLAGTFDRIDYFLDPFPPSMDDRVPPPDPSLPRPALTWAKAIIQQARNAGATRISLADLLSMTDRLFTAADANRDGLLNLPEMSAMLDQLVPRQ